MKIKVKRMHQDARMPFYATEGAACFDLYAVTVSAALAKEKNDEYQ